METTRMATAREDPWVDLENASSDSVSKQNAPSHIFPQQNAPSRNSSQQTLIMSNETLDEDDYQDLYSGSPHREVDQHNGGEKEKDSRLGKRNRTEGSLSPPQQASKKMTT